MKTVTHKGRVYQIGALYFDGMNSMIKLTGIKNEEFHYIDGSGNESTDYEIYSVECSKHLKGSVIGAIEDATIELENGEWYMCESNNGDFKTALYCYQDKLVDNNIGGVDLTPQFKPLHKMVKAS